LYVSERILIGLGAPSFPQPFSILKMSPPTGAVLIARALYELGVTVIFGLVGVPVVQIAEEAIALGIRFIAFRNEQAASYAATAYGYLTGKPGVCLVVGGPGVLHAMAGVGNASANAFPLLLLAGSCETYLVTKGAFQEMDAIALLAPHTKISIRADLDSIPQSISNAYRTAWYGRGGVGFVDLPADVIQGEAEEETIQVTPNPPRSAGDPDRIQLIAGILKSSKAPLIVLGKGAAYAQAEASIRRLINQTNIPFLPTPMGKGVLPDSHPSNTSSARSTALKLADVVLVVGARLNWILHFGEEPKFHPNVKIIQVDITATELGHNGGDHSLSILGDINLVIPQLISVLGDWQYNTASSSYVKALQASIVKNEAMATKLAQVDKTPMTYERTFSIIKDTLHRLSPPDAGSIVYVSEGSNTMDISRSIFPVQHPRLRLDAGTYATMGVGPAYAIAAYAAYNFPSAQESSAPSSNTKKKVVCLEGDSALGFSLAEIETMARYKMDILIFVLNNSGIYHGDSTSHSSWLALQENTLEGGSKMKDGLRSSSLSWEVGYEKVAEMCGGKGFLVRTPEELKKATEEGFKANVPVVINIIIEASKGGPIVSCLILFLLLFLSFVSSSGSFGYQLEQWLSIYRAC
jgi:2-hydroxyacyl-CoA lyase 1